jgi:hypothetical protein
MYSDLVDIIRTASNEVNPEGSFYWGRISDVNVNSPTLSFPQIRLYNNNSIVVNGGVDNANNCLMSFIFQDSVDPSEEERLDIIYNADTLARRFKHNLEEKDIELTNFRIEPFIQMFSGVTSGVNVSFSFNYNSSKVCL